MSKLPKYKTEQVVNLIPYAKNSRVHSDEQVAKIAASIKEFGFTNPILTDGDNGIIAGHGRVMAAHRLGLESVPIIELSHLDENQRRAYVIADNRLALDADWDNEMLGLELDALKVAGFDLGLTGFELEEIEFTLAADDRDSDDGEDWEFDGGDGESSGGEYDYSDLEPTKTEEGYSEYALVMAIENKRKLMDTINEIKRTESIETNEDALMLMVLKYEKNS